MSAVGRAGVGWRAVAGGGQELSRSLPPHPSPLPLLLCIVTSYRMHSFNRVIMCTMKNVAILSSKVRLWMPKSRRSDAQILKSGTKAWYGLMSQGVCIRKNQRRDDRAEELESVSPATARLCARHGI